MNLNRIKQLIKEELSKNRLPGAVSGYLSFTPQEKKVLQRLGYDEEYEGTFIKILSSGLVPEKQRSLYIYKEKPLYKRYENRKAVYRFQEFISADEDEYNGEHGTFGTFEQVIRFAKEQE